LSIQFNPINKLIGAKIGRASKLTAQSPQANSIHDNKISPTHMPMPITNARYNPLKGIGVSGVFDEELDVIAFGGEPVSDANAVCVFANEENTHTYSVALSMSESVPAPMVIMPTFISQTLVVPSRASTNSPGFD